MTDLKRHDRIISPEGRRFVVNAITHGGKVLLERVQRLPREHGLVWKDLATVKDWRRDDQSRP